VLDYFCPWFRKQLDDKYPKALVEVDNQVQERTRQRETAKLSPECDIVEEPESSNAATISADVRKQARRLMPRKRLGNEEKEFLELEFERDPNP